MSIHFNMTNVQKFGQGGFMWDISKSDDSGGSGKKIDKKSQSHPSEVQIVTVKKIAKERIKMKKNDKNHIEELSDHETHIWTERERRKKMRDMFTKIHALLPQLPPKADKSTIVDEAVSSIKSLEQTLQKLQNKKLEKLHYSSPSNTTTPITLAFVPPSSSSPTTLITPKPKIAYDHSNSREAFLANQISSSSTVSVNLPHPCVDPITAFDTWSSRNVVLSICGNEGFFHLCCPKDKSGVLTAVCYLFEKHNIEVLVVNVSSNVYRSTYMIHAQANQLLGDGIGVGEIFKQAAQELVLYVSSL